MHAFYALSQYILYCISLKSTAFTWPVSRQNYDFDLFLGVISERVPPACLGSLPNHVQVLIPGLPEWVGALVLPWATDTVGILHLLWLWYRPAAVAPIWPLAWEPSYAAGVALKSKYIHTYKNKSPRELLLWLNGDKPDCYPWGFRFDPWLTQWIKELALPWALV